ncbi:MAG: hypothetical protein J6O71_04990 [Lachnospiraceae bacterium]|nr:hypothetical protein [Lachnospiraceae bacterium]
MKKVLTSILIAIWILLLIFMGAVTFFIVNPDKAEALGAMLSGNKGSRATSETVSEDGTSGQAAPISRNNGIPVGALELKEPEIDPSGGLELDLEPAYEAPSSSELEIPENVSNRAGYEPVSGEEREIPDIEAINLYKELPLGNTGDDLDFDPLYYPYYAMLGDKGKHLYRQIYANAMDLNGRFSPVERDLGAQGFKNVFASVIGDHPELFWLNTSYECLYDPHGQCAEVNLSFNRTANDLEASKTDFETNAEEILAGARSLESDYEKEKYVHNALIDRIEYNAGAEMNQSAYSALVNDSTVCAGYARAFQYLMQQLEIPCYYCTGYAGEDHAWNIVKLDKDYYNADVTWDDTEGGKYEYFNKSDDDYRRTHARTELAVYLPPCSGGQYSGLEHDDTPAPTAPQPEEEEQSQPQDDFENYIITYHVVL